MAESGRSIINNYLSVAGAQLISVPLSLLYLSFVTRIMGPVNYGKFVLVLACFQFFYTVFINWIRNATIRFGAEEFTKHHKLNGIFYVQILILSITVILTFMLMIIFKKSISGFTGLGPEVYRYLILFLFFYAVFDFICQLLQATHQMRSYGLSLILRQAIILGLVAFCLIFGMGLAPLNLVLIESVSYFSVILISVFSMWNSRYFMPIAFDRAVVSRVLRYSWPIMILYALGYFSLWADTLLIRFFLNFESVGRYEVANRFMQYVSNLILPISIIAFPLAVSIKSEGREHLIHKYAQRIIPQASFFWGIFITLLMFSSGFIFKIIFGSQFTDSTLIFRVLLIGLSFQFLSVMYTAVLQSYDFNQELLYIAVITLALNLFGDLLLIPRMGLMGAAFSKSISFAVCGLMYMFRSIKRVNIEGDSHNNSVFFLALPLLLLACFLLTDNLLLVFASTLLLVLLFYFKAKIAKLFASEDIKFVRQLNIPVYLKSAIEQLYKGLL